jgi:hypothetical protein
MTEYDRPHGIIGYILPEEVGGPSIYQGRMMVLFRNNDQEELYAILKDPANVTIDKVNKYEIVLVGEQGVGYKVTHQKPWRYSDYALTGPGAKFHSMWELVELTKTLEAVDLADHIHMFGARLEGNFHQHFWWATTIPADEYGQQKEQD